MALEAAVFPHELFIKEWYAMVGGAWGHDYGNGSTAVVENEKGVVQQCGGGGCRETGSWELSCSSMVHNFDEWDVNDSSPEDCTKGGPRVPEHEIAATAVVAASGRRKRRRTKTCKNKEEVENQRMTHIAVERNRRKQMNEYLAVLRSLMPASYVQRGDQASIIGGAINFVKELEQLLQSLEAEKQTNRGPAMATTVTAAGAYSTSTPFTNFFTFPQYSMSSSSSNTAASSTVAVNEAVAENRSAIADIEVTMVESHANLKVLSRRRPRQLLKMVVGLHSLQLTVLHLNVTTVDQMVLYSFSVKVEEGCQLNSADEIATAVYRMLGKIQEESGGFN